MGIEDDIEKRRKAKRKAEQEDAEERLVRDGEPISSSDKLAMEKLTELYDRAERLVDQVNNLYTQYFTGVESNPPKTRREQLDQLMSALQLMPKPTEVYRFRFQSVNGTYTLYRSRWERQSKDLENGKLKRIVRPRQRSSGG